MSLIARAKARLKVKFPNVNLSRSRTGKIAAGLDKKLDAEATDDDIDEYLDDLNEAIPFASIAKSDDAARTAEAGKDTDKGKDDDDTETGKKEEQKPDTPNPAQPDFEGILTKLMAPVLDKIKNLEAKDLSTNRIARLETALGKSKEAYKKSTISSFKRMKDLSDDDFEDYLEEIEANAKEFLQADADEKLDSSVQPIMGVKNKSGISTDTESFIASKKEAAKAEGGLVGKALF